MEPQIVRWTRPLGGVGLALIAFLFAACNGAGAGPSTVVTEPSTAPSMASSEAPAGTPGPTDQLEMSINLLPTTSVDTSKVKVACDEATLGTSASMSCDDLVALTARISATMSANPVEQVSVTKPADNPDAIQITFWVKAEEGDELTAFTSVINPANQTFTFPMEDPEAVFPA